MRTSPLRRDDGEDGFTMVEMLAALLVFALFSAGAVAGLIQALHLDRTNQQRVVAANLATKAIEMADQVPTAEVMSSPLLAVGTTTSSVTVGATQYAVRKTVEFVSDASGGSSCQQPSGSTIAYKRISVSVDWVGRAGAAPVTSDTVRELGAGGLAGDKGAISVGVTDASGAAVSGLPVVLHEPGGATMTQTLDADGCALFVGLTVTPNPYSVELNTPGWADPTGQTDSVQGSLTVAASTVTAAQMVYSRDGSVQAQLSDAAGYPQPSSPASLPVTLRSSTTTQVDTGAGSTRLVDVPPAPGGYEVWAGDCTDAAPSGYGQSAAVAAVTAGQTSAVGLHLADLSVRPVSTTTGQPVSGGLVYAVHAADAGCPAGESFLIGTADGAPLDVALPYGSWTIAANPAGTAGPSGAPTTVALSPANDSVVTDVKGF